MEMRSGRGQHRLDGSQHDDTWAGRMRRELDAETASINQVENPVISVIAQHTADQLLSPPEPVELDDSADIRGTGTEQFRRAASDYNRRRAAAYQAYRMASDDAWASYHAAMRQANETYETEVNAAIEAFDRSMAPDGR